MPAVTKRSVLGTYAIGIVAMAVVSGIHSMFDDPLSQVGYAVLVFGSMAGYLLWTLFPED